MNKNHTPKKSNRVIVVGLDAANPDLTEQWIRQGHLPTIKSLMERGSSGKIMSNTDISSGSTWPSVFTGVSAAKHGIYFYHRQIKTGTYEICKKYANQVKRDPFWILLSQAGKKVAILDVPFTYPIKGPNCIQLAAWGSEAPGWERSAWPPELLKEVTSRFGHHPLDSWYQTRPQSINECKDLYDKLILGTRKKGLLLEYFLDYKPWDLFLTVFAETHWAGHLFWHMIDDKYPDYNPELASVFSNAVLNVYSEIDEVISKLIKAAPGSTFIIFSNTGMGPNYSGSHLLPEILERLGMMVNHSESGFTRNSLGNLLPYKRWGPYALKNLESFISERLIERIRRLIPEGIWDKWTCRLLTFGNNWKWSRAFCIINDYSGAIRINLKGREPNGLVEQGKEYDTLCDELIRELGELINTETGKKAVSEVLRIDELCQGENIWDLPDLIVKWTGDAPIRALYSPRIGTVSGENPDKRTGAHRPYGLLVASGQNIIQRKTVEGANIMDIAPTILYLLGQSIPHDMDGKVLLDIIDEDFKANNPVSYI